MVVRPSPWWRLGRACDDSNCDGIADGREMDTALLLDIMTAGTNSTDHLDNNGYVSSPSPPALFSAVHFRNPESRVSF